MEADQNKKEPTKSELEILQILWKYGPSTVRFVMGELNKIREMNYTATLRLMQLMADKGIVKRDESKMQHVYFAAQEENKVKAHLLDKFLDSVYEGSASALMMELAGNKRIKAGELQRMRELLEELEKAEAEKKSS